jgi:hypothetical protein
MALLLEKNPSEGSFMGELLWVIEIALRIEDDEERVCATKYAALVRGTR